MKEMLRKIQKQALDSWKGEEGFNRKERIMKVIRRFTREYAKVLNLKPLEILRAVEEKRDYNVINYYQDANFPSLDESVQMFKNRDEFFETFPSKKFICPCCKGISTHPNTCNSGDLMTQEKKDKKGKVTQKAEVCNWKSYGLFGTLDGGYRFIVKEGFLENPTVYDIFKPIELTTP